MWEQSFPELQAYVIWRPVSGASVYKIYEYGSVGFPCPTADSGYTYDTTVTEPWYLDDPNPAWWQVDPNDPGHWQRRWWCYEISAVVNGVESQRSAPAKVAIGTSGYVTMAFQTTCNGSILPFPYTFAQMTIHLYYKDSSGVIHEIPYLPNVASATESEVEWKLPAIAKDGTIVPVLPSGGKYYYTWKTPDMTQAAQANFLPFYFPDMVTYSQINIRRVQNVGNCPMSWEEPGADYIWVQNVTR